MNNVITKDTVIDCNGSYSIGTWTGGDDGSYGPIKLIRAITVSSNVFFYTTATRLSLAGPYLLENTARALGLGQLTGIELPNEAKGTISGPTLAKEEGISWNPADPAQSGIGQLYNEYTPLQLAAYIGGVVNGGTRYQVHIVKSVKSYDNTKTVLENTPKVVSNFKIPQNYVDLIKQGMYGVTVEGGTAGAVLGDVSLQMGGKTGTTQLGTKQDPKGWDGLFIGFAPYNNPQIVVAVAVENANWGYQTAYVARDVFNYMYLNNPDQTSSPLPLSSGQLIH
jgi:penicillin-binding protein 2